MVITFTHGSEVLWDTSASFEVENESEGTFRVALAAAPKSASFSSEDALISFSLASRVDIS